MIPPDVVQHMAEFHHDHGYEDIEDPAEGYTVKVHADCTHRNDHRSNEGIRVAHIHDAGRVIAHPKDLR